MKGLGNGFSFMQRAVALSLLILGSTFADTTVDLLAIGCSVILPDNWTVEQNNSSTTQYYLYDTTATYKATCSVVRHARNTTDFPTNNDWTRGHYNAYLLLARFSYEPRGVVLYTDSSQNRTQNGSWAPETYCQFYSTDTSLADYSWGEFTKYASTGNYGYEMYAIGDTLDLALNIGLYVAILRSITFPGNAKVSGRFAPETRLTPVTHPTVDTRWVTPLGRVFPAVSPGKTPTGLYLSFDRKVLTVR